MIVEPTVFIIDDDKAVRRFLKGLIKSVGLRAEAYPSAIAFLDSSDPAPPGCILLDIRMPGMSGLELQKILNDRSIILPIIFLTGHGNLQLAVDTMRSGAFDFIEKPFNNDQLLDRVQKAVADSTKMNERHSRRQIIEKLLQQLTPRERQVLDLVANGETSKEISVKLDISTKTVEIHRARVMEKTEAKNVASLVKMIYMIIDE